MNKPTAEETNKKELDKFTHDVVWYVTAGKQNEKQKLLLLKNLL